jgi:hypothetical protein
MKCDKCGASLEERVLFTSREWFCRPCEDGTDEDLDWDRDELDTKPLPSFCSLSQTDSTEEAIKEVDRRIRSAQNQLAIPRIFIPSIDWKYVDLEEDDPPWQREYLGEWTEEED